MVPGMQMLRVLVGRTRSATLSYKTFLKHKVCGSHPSLSTSRSCKNIFKENDDDGTNKLIAELIEEDVKDSDAGRGLGPSLFRPSSATKPSFDQTKSEERWLEMEAEHQAHMDEPRSELRQARQTKDRLRDDREIWKHAAEYYQQDQRQGGDHGEGEEEEEVTPSGRQRTLDPVDLEVVVVVVVEIHTGLHPIAVDVEEVILQDRHQKIQLMMEFMTLRRSRYPGERLTKSSFLRFPRLLILT